MVLIDFLVLRRFFLFGADLRKGSYEVAICFCLLRRVVNPSLVCTGMINNERGGKVHPSLHQLYLNH